MWPSAATARWTPCRVRAAAARPSPGSRRSPHQGLGGQVLQPRAAVEQQHLADHRCQRSRGRGDTPSRPAPSRTCSTPASTGSLPNTRRARVGRVEAAEPVEGGEPAEQVGVGEQVGAGAGADLPGPRLPELAPCWRRSGPTQSCVDQPQKARAELAAAHAAPARPRRARTAAGGASSGAQCRAARASCERPRPAGRSAATARVSRQVVVAPRRRSIPPSPAAPRLGLGQQSASVDSGSGRRPCPERVAAALVIGRWRVTGHRRRRLRSPARVSISTRQAWICSMPRLSLSARSRPDRWM